MSLRLAKSAAVKAKSFNSFAFWIVSASANIKEALVNIVRELVSFIKREVPHAW